jgi:nitrogen PTS system EIIA component
MNIKDVIDPTLVLVSVKAHSKKQLLGLLSGHMARATGLDERTLLEVVLQREREGSTGIGAGIAIPHGRHEAITRVTGLFVKLSQPLDFDSLDGQPVDLVCLLLAPLEAGSQYLKTLALISRLMRNTILVKKIRGCEQAAAIYALITGQDGSDSSSRAA